LITQKSTSPALSDEWLKDFYSYNADGVGVMFSDSDTLVIEKILPKNEKAFIKFYRKHIQGRDCAFHLRMRTHGNIDLENCHPYMVLNMAEHGMDLWLMHNGILTTGNSADPSKSDTWHYIKDYLRPMLVDNPEFAFHPSFAEIVGKHIGESNKFVLMDNLGRQVIINEQAGVYWGGLWLSNEYAWSATYNSSDKPIDDLKLAQEQINDKPVKHSYSTPLSGYYDKQYGSYPDEVLYDEIENIYAEFEHEGLMECASVGFNTMLDFADRFGAESFVEIAYMAIDKAISEEWFIKVINDHKMALEAFPYLADQQYAQELEYV
jgi:predicted glutamine amidotransferase